MKIKIFCCLSEHSFFVLSSKIMIVQFDQIIKFLLKYYSNENLQEYVIQKWSESEVSLAFLCTSVTQFAETLHFLLFECCISYENIKSENCVVNENENLIFIDFNLHDHCNQYIKMFELDCICADMQHDIDAHKKAMIFSLEKSLWMIWKTISLTRLKKIDEQNFNSFCIIFIKAIMIILQTWKNLILQCVNITSSNKSKLMNIQEFFFSKHQIAWCHTRKAFLHE